MILIDCPPALGLLTVNALVAADHALLSAEAQYFALQGVEQALEVIELARDGLNPDLEWLGVVLQHRRHADACTRARRTSRCRSTSATSCSRRSIRQSIAYAESSERAVSILDHRADLGADYVMLADELLGRLKLTDARRRLRPMVEARVERERRVLARRGDARRGLPRRASGASGGVGGTRRRRARPPARGGASAASRASSAGTSCARPGASSWRAGGRRGRSSRR